MEIATSSEGIRGSEMQSHYRANCRPNVKTKRGEKGGEEGRKGGFGSRPRSSLSHSEGFPSFLAQGLHFMPLAACWCYCDVRLELVNTVLISF